METLSREQFKSLYGEEVLNSLGQAPSPTRNPIADTAIGFAKGIGDSVSETANLITEGGRMVQAGLNPNETYKEQSDRYDANADSSPSWVDPFSGETEDNRREALKSDNSTQVFGKGIAFGAEMAAPPFMLWRGGQALNKGQEAVNLVRQTMKKEGVETPTFSREKAGNLVNKYRTQLSDIDPQYETVLKNQENSDKVMQYFDAAEQSAMDASNPMATTIASKRGVDAYTALSDGLNEAGAMKGALLDSIAEVKIGGDIPGRSIEDITTAVGERYGLTIGPNGTLTQTPGRIAKVDDKSQKLIGEYVNELKSLGPNPTARELDDFVDKMQLNLYKQSSPNLFEVADEPVIAFLKSVTGNINSQLKTNVDNVLEARGMDPAYSALNEQYSQLITIQKDLNKALGEEGDKGASLMKSLFSPQTGERTRRLFQSIQDETGINLFDEAVLAKFAMESVGDPRSKSLLKQLDILADDTSQLDLTKPGSWINFVREKVDLDGRDLAEQVIKQNADEVGETTKKVVSPDQEKALQDLGGRINESSSPSLSDNPQAGFFRLPFTGSIGPSVSPENVATKLDEPAFDAITVMLEDLSTARNNPAVNRFLDDMKLNKASDEELESFLKEVTTEYERLGGNPS